MFQPGDLVVYGTTGVCRVEEITKPNLTGADRNRSYYLLKPLYQDGVIYTPAEGGKVPMRPVISAGEAEALIDLIPSIQAEACRAPTLQALAQHYQSAVRSHDCRDLVELMMSIYVKRQQAERLLYGELSIALDIPFEEVQPYIARRVEGISAS